jgi:hypothetical protein
VGQSILRVKGIRCRNAVFGLRVQIAVEIILVGGCARGSEEIANIIVVDNASLRKRPGQRLLERDIYFIPDAIQGVGVLRDNPSRSVIGKAYQPISGVITVGGIGPIRVVDARQVPFVIVLVVVVDACWSYCPRDLPYKSCPSCSLQTELLSYQLGQIS